MQQIGYSLVDAAGTEVKSWSGSIGQMVTPDRIDLPNGDFVHGVSGPCQLGDWRYVRRMGVYGTTSSIAFNGNDVVVTFLVTEAMVIAERERRLALGFTYTFGDTRGAHVIGTSEQDMKGWSEITMASQAAMALGLATTPLNIVTNTGPATVTAQEWQQILLAASQFRQPIWASSFRLQTMAQIPADYTSDSYWQ